LFSRASRARPRCLRCFLRISPLPAPGFPTAVSLGLCPSAEDFLSDSLWFAFHFDVLIFPGPEFPHFGIPVIGLDVLLVSSILSVSSSCFLGMRRSVLRCGAGLGCRRCLRLCRSFRCSAVFFRGGRELLRLLPAVLGCRLSCARLLLLCPPSAPRFCSRLHWGLGGVPAGLARGWQPNAGLS